nr:response regulator transcription factor [Pseudomaricurvus sp. HS19]
MLVEDDLLLGDSVQAAVAAEGYAVDWLTSGAEVLSALKASPYDLVILDQRLPGLEGTQILKQLRSGGDNTPVLMLTACDALGDKVAGLDAGADDYLTKPFDMDELFARMRSLLRRLGSKAPTLISGELELDPAARVVTFRGETIADLTLKEFSILETLLRNRGRFITKAQLLDSSNNWQEEVESNTIEVYISRLRKRFGRDAIETLRGVGYRFR